MTTKNETAVSIKGEVSLTNLDDILNQEVQTALENIDPRPPRIVLSREAQVFLLPDGSTEKSLAGTIMYHHKARSYYETEEGGDRVPDCGSFDGIAGIKKETGEEVSCATCPLNAWGSGKDGRGKACKEKRWIYFLQEDEVIPSIITLPPTSLGQFDSFVTALAQRRIAPIMKQVRIGLEKTERHGFTYSVLGQPEVLGDVEREKIVEMLQLRDAVVAATRKEGISSDYFSDGDAGDAAGDADEPY